MKYFGALLGGIITGALVAVVFFLFNPASSRSSALSPLAVSENPQLALRFSAVADDAIVYTNDGESRVSPKPERVLQLWEAPIRETDVIVTLIGNSRGDAIGLGTKFSSRSRDTSLVNREILVDSIWHVYLPGEGTLLFEQRENRWDYVREIVIPAHWSSGDNWRGRWRGTTTVGPGSLGTGRVHGGSGVFQGIETEAIEVLSATAYATDTGPVSVDGEIIVDLPDPSANLAEP